MTDTGESASTSVPLYVGGLQTIFVDGPSRSSITRSSFRVAGSTLHRHASGVVSYFFPLSSPLPPPPSSSHFFSPLLRGPPFAGTVTIRGEERSTSKIQNSPRLRRLECRERATWTDKRLLGMTKTRVLHHHGLPLCVSGRKIRVRVPVVLRTIETRCPSTCERRFRGEIWRRPYTHERVFLRSMRQWQTSVCYKYNLFCTNDIFREYVVLLHVVVNRKLDKIESQFR